MPHTVETSSGIQTEKCWNQKNKKFLCKSKHSYVTKIPPLYSIVLAKSVVFLKKTLKKSSGF